MKRLESTIYIPEGNRYIKDYDAFSIKYFTGYVNQNSFKINRNVVTTKSFLPDIKGTISPNNSGAIINIKIMQMTTYIIYSIFIIFLILSGLAMNLLSKEFKVSNLIPFGVAVAAYFLALFSFQFANRNLKGILLNIFEGEIQ